MLARVYTSAIQGIGGYSVSVETEIRQGKSNFAMVGLGDNAVKEAKERIQSALRFSGFKLPNRLLVNLAPAEIKKEGASFDLAIALSILSASRQIQYRGSLEHGFYGELSLDGTIKPVRGLVAMLLEALEQKVNTVIVPFANAEEASLVRGLEIIPVNSLAQVVGYLKGDTSISAVTEKSTKLIYHQKDLSDVRGQNIAKRAMLISATGGHNLLMLGPPGCGKSMLAERFNCLLPKLNQSEAQAVVKIYSAMGLPIEALLSGVRPYRSPHHGISEAGLVGGGSPPRPGEISLAHNGVLFLDELPEFRRSVLEAIRAPLEARKVSIARAKGTITFPANFQFISAMNPCPCGRLGVPNVQCLCGQHEIGNYLKKISQPILDRIDLHVELDAIPVEHLRQINKSNDTNSYKEQLLVARDRAFQQRKCLNSLLSNKQLEEHVKMDSQAEQMLERATKSGLLSARGYFRLLKVSLTIADLAGSSTIKGEHLAEALSYRVIEKLHPTR